MTTQQDAADAAAYHDLTEARPLEEWHEDMGPMLWWAEEQKKCPRCDGDGAVDIHANLPDVKCVPCDGKGTVGTGKWLGEAPYVGSPLDCGFEVMVNIEASIWTFPNKQVGKEQTNQFSRMVGGWPGYHTHFTPLPPMPKVPK